MTSIGRAHGAITVINAMPCGIGATVGVNLSTEARFEIAGDERVVCILNDEGEDTSMARYCVRDAFRAAGVPEPEGWRLETDSTIPVSRGLKSSSTACNAIIRAVLAEVGHTMDPVDLIRLGVGCAKEAGVTVTGSFDDACGSGLGGFVITDNTRNEVLHSTDVDELDVIIHVPRYKIRKRGLPLEALRSVAPRIKEAIELAREDPFAAMTMNGRIISEVSDVDNSVAERAVSMGALGAGMSGSGPAVAIVVPRGDGRRFAEDLGLPDDETIFTSTRCGE